MKRAAEERTRTVREWKRHVAITHAGDASRCLCDRQPGRFRKVHGTGCHRPRCMACHGEKILKIPRRAQRRANESYHQQLRELHP